MTVLIIGAIVIWGQVQLRLRRGDLHDRKLSGKDDSTIVLTGILGPMATIPIEVRNLRLAVPLNSWVQEGQSLGEADSGSAWEESAAQSSDVSTCREAARAAIAEAQQNAQEIEAELENARSDDASSNVQLTSLQSGELEAEQDFERRDTLFRQGLIGDQDYNASVAARSLAESAVEAARSRQASTSAAIGDLNLRAQVAQSRLAETTAWNQAVEDASLLARRSAAPGPVLSPADGLIVAGALPGTYGIASDASLLRARTQVSPSRLASLRLGQSASITAEQLPGENVNARIIEISKKPIASSTGPAYPVELLVENPSGLRLEGITVRITLR